MYFHLIVKFYSKIVFSLYISCGEAPAVSVISKSLPGMKEEVPTFRRRIRWQGHLSTQSPFAEKEKESICRLTEPSQEEASGWQAPEERHDSYILYSARAHAVSTRLWAGDPGEAEILSLALGTHGQVWGDEYWAQWEQWEHMRGQWSQTANSSRGFQQAWAESGRTTGVSQVKAHPGSANTKVKDWRQWASPALCKLQAGQMSGI